MAGSTILCKDITFSVMQNCIKYLIV